jgi:hypothetical protein
MVDRVNAQRPVIQEADQKKLIEKMITGIARSAVKLNESIHNTAVLCAEHAQKFGDCTLAAKLVDAVPLSHRRNLLVQWFDAFTAIGLGKDAKSQGMKAHLKGKAEERDAMWQIEAGKATPFYAMKGVEREPEMPTFEAWSSNVLAFFKRSRNMADKIESEAEKTRAIEVLDRLEADAKDLQAKAA